MRRAAFLTALALFTFGSVVPAFAAEPASKPAKVRIALAGDSTVTDSAGWGIGFAKSMNADVQVTNFSKGGRSSKSFIDEGHWKPCLESKPDYVLIQFGHNDQPGKGPTRETDPKTTYREFMSRYVDEARSAGIKPVLVTSIERRAWGKDANAGKIRPTLTPQAEAVRELAAEKHVPLIDLNALSIAVYEKIGADGCNELSPMKDENGKKVIDTTHLNAKGSETFGRIVAEELAKAVPDLAPYIKR